MKQKRFFTLHQGWKVLYYFIHDRSINAQGYINLRGGCKVARDSHDAKSFTIYDAIKDRLFYLSANSGDEVVMWVRTLQVVIVNSRFE
ncbi:MAG: hypothetical protein NXI00_22755 [Cytophagales bacterium]|nr:hypothetical protein [Cytophagales bacterium]